jgi:Asp/Glu/hydantoin racemase
LKKRIGCLHAHYSNISYIENALSAYDVQLSHFVDPGLMQRVMNDESFTELDAKKKVKEQIEWVAQSGVDAILITCTNYIALMEQITVNVPIIKMDEPYFEAICKIDQHQTILFTNPNTVTGTMNRLQQYAKLHQKTLDIEVEVIENTFDLIMSGKNEEYNNAVCDYIMKLVRKDLLSVAQLSMVAAAQQVEDETSVVIINPLNTLVSSMVHQLDLQKTEQR